MWAGLALLLVNPPQVHVRAHSHNDYWRDRPLELALEHGFCSVEADVFLVDGQLLVGHERSELTPERTLEAMYLAPLARRIRANGGRVYPGGPEFWLLVDVKADGEAVVRHLAELLRGYAGVLNGGLRVVISGDRPRDLIFSGSVPVGYDGRHGDLADMVTPADAMPLISMNWWDQFGPSVGEADRLRLRSLVRQAHLAGRRIRFWGHPQTPLHYQLLNEAGVDLINTDDIPGLAEWLTMQK